MGYAQTYIVPKIYGCWYTVIHNIGHNQLLCNARKWKKYASDLTKLTVCFGDFFVHVPAVWTIPKRLALQGATLVRGRFCTGLQRRNGFLGFAIGRIAHGRL